MNAWYVVFVLSLTLLFFDQVYGEYSAAGCFSWTVAGRDRSITLSHLDLCHVPFYFCAEGSRIGSLCASWICLTITTHFCFAVLHDNLSIFSHKFGTAHQRSVMVEVDLHFLSRSLSEDSFVEDPVCFATILRVV